MPLAELVTAGEFVLAYILRSEATTRRTTFVTPESETLQMGLVAYPAGGEVPRHAHRPIARTLVGTAEVVIVRQGRCELDLYSETGERLASRELRQGDVALILRGGHGFRMHEDTVLLEIKQGPYTGLAEKECF